MSLPVTSIWLFLKMMTDGASTASASKSVKNLHGFYELPDDPLSR